MRTADDSRLLSLDVARGIAALCVVVFHWAHFGLMPAAPGDEVAVRPFWKLLKVLYAHGGNGVDFFFVLSGAIFFIKYANAISSREVGGWRFFVLRFSRLYPLHLATLILVAVLQYAVLSQVGRFFIYQHNDVAHFAVNLLFIQDWAVVPLLRDLSFNAPAWSLSVEALLYLIFFALFRFVRPGSVVCAGIAVIGLVLYAETPLAGVGQGLWCFFLGGIVATWCKTKPRGWLCAITALAFVLAWFTPYEWAIFGQLTFGYLYCTIFFVGLVGCLIVFDRSLQRPARILSWLGDISYSSYLLHFPLQIMFVLPIILIEGRYVGRPFGTTWMMPLFFAVLIPLSLACYRLFEAPARRGIRSALLRKRDTVAA
jgi:peptidoglycan/LPS O-acetylase OafA/YrhL